MNLKSKHFCVSFGDEGYTFNDVRDAVLEFKQILEELDFEQRKEFYLEKEYKRIFGDFEK